MTHDQMCVYPKTIDGVTYCVCSTIAAVRKDERRLAAERVETLRETRGVITISAAAALAAGDTWTSQW